MVIFAGRGIEVAWEGIDKQRAIRGLREVGTNLNKHMTNYLNRRVGKMLFPHLPRDQRKHQLLIILLVMAASFSASGSLIMWMTAGRH